MTNRDLQFYLKEISKLGLSSAELSKVKEAFADPAFERQLATAFEDPIVASKVIESFEVPVFRENFFEDPIVAINSITRRR